MLRVLKFSAALIAAIQISPALALRQFAPLEGHKFLPGYELLPEYPPDPFSAQVEGYVVIDCELQANGALASCTVRDMTPEIYGFSFSDAAMKAAASARLDILAMNLSDRVGTRLGVSLVYRFFEPSKPAGMDVFAEGAELSVEDRAAIEVPQDTPPESACPDAQDCGVAY